MTRRRRLPLVAAIGLALPVLAALVLAAAPARAEDSTLSWLDRTAFEIDKGRDWLWSQVSPHLPAAPPTLDSIATGAMTMARTLVGDPITAMNHAIAGRPNDAWRAAQRVVVNLTSGQFGTVDQATRDGLVVPPIDLGLALCVRGVPAGPSFVIPWVGPRTLRDGLADLGLGRMLIGTVTGMPDGTVLAIAWTYAWAKVAEALGQTPDGVRSGDYDVARAAYLASREAQCAALSTGG